MPIFGPKICIFLRYAHITPIFWGQMDPNQWDHKSPISWGNSGYLWFSGRWPFGRSAGRFSAPIAQSGPFWAQKRCFFWPEINFLWTASKKIISGQKKHFLAQKGPLWAIGAEKRPAERPNGHLPENQSYPELPQDMGDLWSHWVGFVWPQKMGVIWV